MQTNNQLKQLNLSIIPSQEHLTKLIHAKDYAGLMSEPMPPLGIVKIDGQLFTEILPEIICKCPRDLQKLNPISMLRFAYFLFSAGKQVPAKRLMMNIYTDIEEAEDKESRSQLLGEWMFIKALMQYPDIEKMLEAMESANQLSKGNITVLDANEPYLFHLSSPYAVFHTIPGQAKEQGEKFAQFNSLYEKLTNGGGRGAAELYEAGLSYYQGDFKQAGLLCYKAAYLAESKRQAAISMGAGRVLALIGINNMDMETFSQGMEMLEHAAGFHPEYGMQMNHLQELVRTELYFEVSVTEYTPKWIQKGTLELFPEVSQPYLKYAQMRYFYYSGSYEKCIGLGEALLKPQHQLGVLVNATIAMFVAFAYFQLGYNEQGMELFKESFDPLFKDRLYLIFTYYYEKMDGVLDEYLKENYADDEAAIFSQMEKNKRGRLLFMNTFLNETNNLTKKEYEAAVLAARGLKNKEIAKQMDVSVNTVRAHLRNVFSKLDIDRRSEIVKRLNISL